MLRRNKREQIPPTETPRDQQFIPVAKSLVEKLDDQIERSFDDPEAEVDEVFQAAMVEVAKPILATKLEAMPAEEFARLYAARLGDTALREMLEKYQQQKRDDLERRTNLQEIAKETGLQRRLNLGRLEPLEIITIGLFDPSVPKQANWHCARDYSFGSYWRSIELQITEPLLGMGVVLNDIWREPVRHSDDQVQLFAPLTKVEIGLEISSADNSEFQPIISAHAPLSIRQSGSEEFITHPHIVGFVRTSDNQTLLDYYS